MLRHIIMKVLLFCRESALESVRACTLRGQLELVKLDEPIPLSEVEPAVDIVKRFATGKLLHYY